MFYFRSVKAPNETLLDKALGNICERLLLRGVAHGGILQIKATIKSNRDSFVSMFNLRRSTVDVLVVWCPNMKYLHCWTRPPEQAYFLDLDFFWLSSSPKEIIMWWHLQYAARVNAFPACTCDIQHTATDQYICLPNSRWRATGERILTVEAVRLSYFPSYYHYKYKSVQCCR